LKQRSRKPWITRRSSHSFPRRSFLFWSRKWKT
jgi:hypothetical protein